MRYLLIILALSCGAVQARAQASLAEHEAFATNLSQADLVALREAAKAERGAADLLLRFYEAYDDASAVVAAYRATSDVRVADSLHTAFERAVILEKGAAEQLAGLWEQIFDNKTYAYNYLLEVLGRYDTLEQMQQLTMQAASNIADGREGSESVQVLRYLAQKELIFSYEETMARLLTADAALDSLGGAKHVFGLLKRPLPQLSLPKRTFITFEPIKTASPARYSTVKPIPAVEVFRQGLVYRVRLGNYSAKQAVSVFRGVYPLGYAQSGTRWDYYAGAYAGLDEAVAAVAAMKKRGFADAAVAAWNDGVLVLLGTGDFVVEIVRAGSPASDADGSVSSNGSVPELSDAVRTAVAATGKDLVLSGDRFVLGRFESGLDAERAAVAIRAANPALHVRVKSEK